ncbi:hypothetical protein [Microtetraspora malaysiensis]|uniref:hypothetical protein n=1 Tax=Microtetraspora malaysiensis TaxID=161358 RepID=UPI00082BE896|nr:hypothetical protein [Microtetraspora malaysiensis]
MAIDELPAGYHGVHPAHPKAGGERLEWRECHPRAIRIRVLEHTCECQDIVYELCQAGGLLFVRRHYRAADGAVVTESEWLRAVPARRLWTNILLGHVR